MNTTLALAFFWFLFASSSGFGMTGDFSKNKLQYDIANVRQLPISYKVFRSPASWTASLLAISPLLNMLQGGWESTARTKKLRKTKSNKKSNFGKLYAVGGCNSLCRILERKIIENYLKNNNHGLDDVQGKYGHFLRDRRSQAEENFQLLPWQMKYSSPRLRRGRRSQAEEDFQLLPWKMEYSSPRLRRDARAESVANKEDGQLLPWEMEYFTPRLS